MEPATDAVSVTTAFIVHGMSVPVENVRVIVTDSDGARVPTLHWMVPVPPLGEQVTLVLVDVEER